MPSAALREWRTDAAERLGALDDAHQRTRGAGRGALTARRQLVDAFCVMLAAEFQGFVRKLHTEACTIVADDVAGSRPALRQVVVVAMTTSREIDRGNARRDVLDRDFKGRLGLVLGAALEGRSAQNRARLARLQELNERRNAIAHRKHTNPLALGRVRAWRSGCDALAREIDAAVGDHLGMLLGRRPW